jgi:hypothetical protein
MLRPVRTVRVTSKEELDAALATTADQITVEGDDELLSYAINKAAGDPENRVAVDSPEFHYVGGGGSSFRPEDIVEVDDPEFVTRLATPEELRPLEEHKARLAAAERRLARAERLLSIKNRHEFLRPGLIIIAAALVALLLIASATGWYLRSGVPYSAPLGLVQGDTLSSVLWPLVAIVAIIALFLVARQAIASGSNVTITWKVTEGSVGKVGR